MGRPEMHSHPLRRLLTWTGLILCLFLLYQLAPVLTSERIFQIDDFVEYWSAGRLNLAGQNPYAPELMEALQRSIGRNITVMMWNPPMTLALAMPFALLPYPFSRLAWLLVETAAVLVSATWLWELCGGARRTRWLAWAVAFFYSATLTGLHTGQNSSLILLGLAGFLRFERAGKHGVAGAFAALTLLKPHLLYLFWLVWLVHSWRQRRWIGPAAAVGAVLAGTAIAMAFNPSVVSQYVQSALQNGPIWWHTATLGGALRGLFGPEHRWLQFAPVLLGLGWLAVQWRGARNDWCWPEQMPLLVIVSIVTAAYGWTFDQVVLLVMLIPAACMLAATWRASTAARALILAGIGLNWTDLGLRWIWIDDASFWWLATAWLAWYVGFRRWSAVYRMEQGEIGCSEPG